MHRMALALLIVIGLALALFGTPPLAAQGETLPLFLFAYNCEADPGPIGMVSPAEVPAGCERVAGVAFAVTDQNGVVLDSCETAGDFPLCSVDVPLATTITVTEDVSTIPAGFVPTANPRTWTTPSQFVSDYGAEFINVRAVDQLPNTGTGTDTTPRGQMSDYLLAALLLAIAGTTAMLRRRVTR